MGRVTGPPSGASVEPARWSEIRSVHDEGDTIVITTRNGSALLIPRRAFGKGIDRQRFVNDVEAWQQTCIEPDLIFRPADRLHVTLPAAFRDPAIDSI